MTLKLWLQSTRSLIEEAIEHISKRGTRGSPARKERPLKLVTLEDRIVFSATPLLVLPFEPGLEAADGQSPEGTPPPEEDLSAQSPQSAQSDDQAKSTEVAGTEDRSTASTTSPLGENGQTAADSLTVSRHELVIIDAAVGDYQQRIDSLLTGNNTDRQIDVVTLDEELDGIAQITVVLAEHEQLDAVHLVSQGSEGSLKLGASLLSADTMAPDAGQIALWQRCANHDSRLRPLSRGRWWTAP